MPVEQFIKPGKLIEYFDSRVRECLEEHRLYSIDAYGWRNAEDTDPEYDGYAKWHTAPKVEFDFEAHFNNKPFRIKPDNVDIEMVSNGYDFMEVMKAAWLALGQAVFFHEYSKNKAELEFTYLSLNLISAVMQLNLAFDRLREYFIIASMGRSPARTDGGFSKCAEIVLAKTCSDDERLPLAAGILDLSKSIFANRELRNRLTHELASNNAVFQRQLLEEQRMFHDVEVASSGSGHSRNVERSQFRYLEEDLEKTISTYRQLIELGNLVFKFEYLSRGTT